MKKCPSHIAVRFSLFLPYSRCHGTDTMRIVRLEGLPPCDAKVGGGKADWSVPKPENVTIEGLGPFPRVLLADFGAAARCGKPCTKFAGTVTYLPPEAILHSFKATGAKN
jgi:serine/threonine protein kinase